MELCIGIQAALACLAILSRIHFSKYKDGDIKGLKHIREEVQALRVLTRREAVSYTHLLTRYSRSSMITAERSCRRRFLSSHLSLEPS